MYETNHEMMDYGFIEGSEFEGLMPKVIEKIGGVGASETNVSLFPDVAKTNAVPEFLGHDALEVVDIEKAFDGEGGGESSDGGSEGESESE